VPHDRLAIRRQPLETVAASHDLGLQMLFQLADPHGKGRLRHAAFLCRAGKVFLPRKRRQKMKILKAQHTGAHVI